MSVVREPRAETADPFGDFPTVTAPRPPAEPVPMPDSPPPTSDDFEIPEYEPAPGSGGTGSGFLAAGVARIVGIGVVVAISTGGFGLFVRSVGHEGAPNVPDHVLETCSEAKLIAAPLELLAGTPIAYDQMGSEVRVTYEASQGVTWTCMYAPFDRTAVVTGLGDGLG